MLYLVIFVRLWCRGKAVFEMSKISLRYYFRRLSYALYTFQIQIPFISLHHAHGLTPVTKVHYSVSVVDVCLFVRPVR